MRRLAMIVRAAVGSTPPKSIARGAFRHNGVSRAAAILKLRQLKRCGIVRAKSVEETIMGPRISYVQPSTVTDKKMLEEFDRCAREGTPRPESQAIRAHVPATFWSFANTWQEVFRNGVADH
jgi:hypothetical protein